MEEATKAAAIRKTQEVTEWNLRMSFLLLVQRALERRRPSPTAVDVKPGEDQRQQNEAAGDVPPAGFRREPDSR